MKPFSYSGSRTALAVAVLQVFVATYSADAAEDVIAAPDSDGDGDGDSLGNFGVFQLTDEIQGGGTNQLYHNSTHDFEYFVSGQAIQVWNDFTAPGSSDKYFGAHLLETIDPGGFFGFGQTFEYGLTESTYGMRESTAILPAETLLYLGLQSSAGTGSFTSDSFTLDANLNPIDISGSASAPANYSPYAGGFGAADTFDWFSFEVDEFGTMSEWTIKTKNEKAGTADPLLQWVLHVELPTGESVGQSTPWDVENNDPDPYSIPNDLVFAWTVNSKNDKNTPPLNTMFNPVPEPTSLLTTILGLGAVAFRRRRK